jgi:hypothetical protein
MDVGKGRRSGREVNWREGSEGKETDEGVGKLEEGLRLNL